MVSNSNINNNHDDDNDDNSNHNNNNSYNRDNTRPVSQGSKARLHYYETPSKGNKTDPPASPYHDGQAFLRWAGGKKDEVCWRGYTVESRKS